MKFAQIEHWRCDEPDGTTLIWIPDNMTKNEFQEIVSTAKNNYLNFIQNFLDVEPPNNYRSYGGPPYEKYPDKTVQEVKDMWELQKIEYEKWQTERNKAYRTFGNYLEELGLISFYKQHSDFYVKVNWGHRHGTWIETDITTVEDLAGPLKQNKEDF